MDETYTLFCFKCQKDFEWKKCPPNCRPIEDPNYETDIAWTAFCPKCNTVNLVWLRCQGKTTGITIANKRVEIINGWIEPPLSPPV